MRATAAEMQGRMIVLKNGRAVFGDVHVLGATLWTDYAANVPECVEFAMRQANNCLTEHVRCRLRGSKFGPSAARGLHFTSRAWFGAEVAKIRAEDPDAKVVVATHHAPIVEANPPQYRGGALAPAFASDMRAENAEWRPEDAWFSDTRITTSTKWLPRLATSVAFRPRLIG